MIRAYVFDGNYLIEKLVLEHPLQSVFIVKKKPLEISFAGEFDVSSEPTIEKVEYKYLFRSHDNGVIIYSNDDALSFMERSMRWDIAFQKEQFEWKMYQAPVVMTFERREVIEQIIKEFIPHIRENNPDADSVIAETCARKINAYLVNP